MQLLHNHIVLIGFKHTGKSVIGKNLAKALHVSFIDLDLEIENLYEKRNGIKLTCRQIMQQNGEKYFRLLELNTLSKIADYKPSIISVGGGTPLHAENQRIIKSCIIIQITAPRGIVFERILMSGQPAFFNPEVTLLESFNQLWDEREKVYEHVKDFSIENNGTVDNAANKIIAKLNLGSK